MYLKILRVGERHDLVEISRIVKNSMYIQNVKLGTLYLFYNYLRILNVSYYPAPATGQCDIKFPVVY